MMHLDELIITLQNLRVNIGRGDVDVLDYDEFRIVGAAIETAGPARAQEWGCEPDDKYIWLHSDR